MAPGFKHNTASVNVMLNKAYISMEMCFVKLRFKTISLRATFLHKQVEVTDRNCASEETIKELAQNEDSLCRSHGHISHFYMHFFHIKSFFCV